MRKNILVLVLSLFLLACLLHFPLREASAGFKDEQMRFSRFSQALKEKEPSVRALFSMRGVKYPPERIYIRAFKAEGVMELWAKADGRDEYVLIKSYAFCNKSGGPGPKRHEGDSQVPEGFYHIDRFNPESTYFLSLGLDYPNAHDRKHGWDGGDIFIHGDCITEGCIPITDDKIKELYIIAAEARARGQERIPVHLFPARLDERGFRSLLDRHKGDRKLAAFWSNLKVGFDIFDKTRRVPDVQIDGSGRYVFISDVMSAALINYVLDHAPQVHFRLGDFRGVPDSQ